MKTFKNFINENEDSPQWLWNIVAQEKERRGEQQFIKDPINYRGPEMPAPVTKKPKPKTSKTPGTYGDIPVDNIPSSGGFKTTERTPESTPAVKQTDDTNPNRIPIRKVRPWETT